MTTLRTWVGGDYQYNGIAAVGQKLYCAPHNSTSVLIIDAATNRTTTVETGLKGDHFYHGIAAVGNKLYCCPSSASSVLVIDAGTDTTSFVTWTSPAQTWGTHAVSAEPVSWKWAGIAAVGPRLFCAPCNSSWVLVIDTKTDTTTFIETGFEGDHKWSGIAAVGERLYCAPFQSSSVLVIDSATNKTTTIETHIRGEYKFAGIAAKGTKLYCSPLNFPSVLVIDTATNATSIIQIGIACNWKWSGIATHGDKLFCSPCNASSVLVIDTATSKTTMWSWASATTHAGLGELRWAGIEAVGDALFCAPHCAEAVLVINVGPSTGGLRNEDKATEAVAPTASDTNDPPPPVPPMVQRSYSGLTADAAARPTLISMVQTLMRTLSLEGDASQVVAGACKKLGVSTEGKSLLEQATECYKLATKPERIETSSA